MGAANITAERMMAATLLFIVVPMLSLRSLPCRIPMPLRPQAEAPAEAAQSREIRRQDLARRFFRMLP
jgi:hypothetical protein